ncbi:uncharacterized protein MONBRDRAFT_26361 [Monosiga brevicollis MX1]|uniref:protein-tyrosine-phosphatase n=1 Tax=Monosiga brevicollis TaxID=81824 RepID=A9V253_MONBE|nr:uncharacterized protein MONBRDRAFT_26361 [Monosiga brevicollis MX1]EDQ88193.1 predicted protein [Monosiga brevicollis MX1]|eukprot:XP_001746786.1 hypothetical protein [Monosiga brevicollis MX1]
MGQLATKDTVAHTATLHRQKVTKREYTRADLDQMVTYLVSESRRLKTHLRGLQQQPQGWQMEYGGLAPIGTDQPAEASKRPENVTQNRYINIVAYDHSRVTVKPSEATKNNDYINANWVPGYKGDKAYIACQGPVPDAFAAFWQMIWEQAVGLIVMITNEVEAGKLKCHRYWPDPNSELRVGNFVIKSISEVARTSFIERHFELTDQTSGQTVPVQQMQYILWPDRLCNAAEDMHPMLHPRDVVAEMRKSRNFLVQTLVQYGFVYLALLDAIDRGLGQAKQAISLLDEQAGTVLQTELNDLNQELAVAAEAQKAHPESDKGQQDIENLQKQTENVKTRVTTQERMHAFMTAVGKKTASANRDELVADWRGLEERVKSYKEEADAGEFNRQYSTAVNAWQPDQYAVEVSLTPLESRKAALTAQVEAIRLRGKSYRQQIDDFERERLLDLKQRVRSLQESVDHAESNARKIARRASDVRVAGLAAATTTSLTQRVSSLQVSNASSEVGGRVVPTPVPAKAGGPVPLEVEATPESTPEAPLGEEGELSEPATVSSAELYDNLIDNVWQNSADVVPEVDASVQEQSFTALRKAPPKAAKAHPMIAAMAKTSATKSPFK